jgi:hypothetical protein
MFSVGMCSRTRMCFKIYKQEASLALWRSSTTNSKTSHSSHLELEVHMEDLQWQDIYQILWKSVSCFKNTEIIPHSHWTYLSHTVWTIPAQTIILDPKKKWGLRCCSWCDISALCSDHHIKYRQEWPASLSTVQFTTPFYSNSTKVTMHNHFIFPPQLLLILFLQVLESFEI